MRVVLDTNVVSSALLWGGTPERLIELAGEGSIELFTSEALLADLCSKTPATAVRTLLPDFAHMPSDKGRAIR